MFTLIPVMSKSAKFIMLSPLNVSLKGLLRRNLKSLIFTDEASILRSMPSVVSFCLFFSLLNILSRFEYLSLSISRSLNRLNSPSSRTTFFILKSNVAKSDVLKVRETLLQLNRVSVWLKFFLSESSNGELCADVIETSVNISLLKNR